MNAVVSGRAGLAFLLQADGKLFSIHQGDFDQVVARRAEEFSWLFGDAADLEFFEGVDLPEVSRLLDFAAQREEALDIVLILLDGDLPDTVRKQAAEDLEECFLNPKVQDAVEFVLYAAPLPEDADLKSALRYAAARKKVLVFVELLFDRQPIIRKIRQAWESVGDQHFGGRPDRLDARTICIRAGLFRSIVQMLVSGKVDRSVLVQALTQHSNLRRFETALERWGLAVEDMSEFNPTINKDPWTNLDNVQRRSLGGKAFDATWIHREIDHGRINPVAKVHPPEYFEGSPQRPESRAETIKIAEKKRLSVTAIPVSPGNLVLESVTQVGSLRTF